MAGSLGEEDTGGSHPRRGHGQRSRVSLLRGHSSMGRIDLSQAEAVADVINGHQ